MWITPMIFGHETSLEQRLVTEDLWTARPALHERAGGGGDGGGEEGFACQVAVDRGRG
jgi:hypothetical protein